MFQFRRFPSIRYGLAYGCMRYAHTGFPIQTSADQWIFAPPRSFSQLITSFIGSQCQGIHPALFFAWPVCCFNSVWNRVCFLKKLFQLLNNYVYVWFANFRLLFSDVLIKISQIFFLNTFCMKFSMYIGQLHGLCSWPNGDGEIRTLDPLLARQVLSQLSYTPIWNIYNILFIIWQPPAFPYRLQYSIIGRFRLNHRVRDVDGCFPKAHRHQKCSVI